MSYERATRPGLMLYHDDYDITLRPLQPEARANIIEAIMDISIAISNGEAPPPEPSFKYPESIAFAMMKKKVLSDQMRYEERCEKNRQNRAKQEKKKLEEQKKAEELEKENARLRKELDDGQQLSRAVDERQPTTTSKINTQISVLKEESSSAAKAAAVNSKDKGSRNGKAAIDYLLDMSKGMYTRKFIKEVVTKFGYEKAEMYIEKLTESNTDEPTAWLMINSMKPQQRAIP